MLLQQRDGDHGGGDIAPDQLAVLVHQEHAVGIAIEGNTQIAALLDDGFLQVDHRRRVDRIGGMIRKGAVELEIHRHQLAGKMLEEERDRAPGHAIARRRPRP